MSSQVYIDGRSHHEGNFYKQQTKPEVSNIPAGLPAELMDQLLELEESVKKNNSSTSSVVNSCRSSSSSDTSHGNIKVTSIRKVVKDDDENKSKTLALYSIIFAYHRGGRFSCFHKICRKLFFLTICSVSKSLNTFRTIYNSIFKEIKLIPSILRDLLIK